MLAWRRSRNSSFNVGDDLPKGTVAELISQDPKE